MSTSAKPARRLAIVRAEDVHAPAIAELFRAVGWDDDASAESVRRSRRQAAQENQAAPGEDVPTFLVLQDERAIGFVSSIPIRLWNGARELPAHWVKGLMVLPEFRNGPVGFLVLKEAVHQLPRSLAVTVAPASKRLFGALGYTDVGAIPNYVRLLRPGRVLGQLDLEQLGMGGLPAWAPRALRVAQRLGAASLGGGLAGAALRAGAAAVRLPARGLRVAPLELEGGPLDPLDALWRAAAPRVRGAVVRDASYLAWRYGARSRPDGPYRVAVASQGGAARGLLVLRRPQAQSDPRLQGLRVATIADLVFDPADARAGLALLGRAEREARELGADAVLCTTAHAGITPLLRRQGYVKLPGNVHFFLRDVSGEPVSWPTRLDDWWLTRGDGESDETF